IGEHRYAAHIAWGAHHCPRFARRRRDDDRALRCERIIERVGHIRAYAALAGMVVAATAAMPLLVGPLSWLILRGSSVLVALVFSLPQRAGSTPRPSQLSAAGSSQSTCSARFSLLRWDSC